MTLKGLLKRLLAALRASLLCSEGGIRSNADRHSRASTTIATGILERLGAALPQIRLRDTTPG